MKNQWLRQGLTGGNFLAKRLPAQVENSQRAMLKGTTAARSLLPNLNFFCHLATQAGMTLTQEDLERRALQWATRHNGCSGRTARQFVNFLQVDLVVSSQK